ncbi:radical SAM protein [Anaerotalea alkaliphila]|uniref:Radical SAM protein n=1 Tax=Anaerotalea alkaliphila TaxID=2662126 RepID=A0A7X5HVY8_9FIRM|nr:radical SAM protein [Anaerotalea alkaliphila]NDL67451.1 radical SAM protein [Anaerotalea alkaliphila]
MRLGMWLKLACVGSDAFLFKRDKPVVGSIILTDRCNLSCRHCAVGNSTGLVYPHAEIRSEMRKLLSDGVRILFFYGGEPFLWEDEGVTLGDLVAEAKGMGFLLVNVVTNGTFPLDLPEADLLLVSLDGGRESHNAIRGDTYDRVLGNVRCAPTGNICLYMAVNRINKGDIGEVCRTAKRLRNVKAVSFNFHTPYPGTEDLKLDREEKRACCERIGELMDQGFPVLNLRSAFGQIADNSFPTPCRRCVVLENGREWVCGRCIDIDGLCRECGYFFAAEFSLLFSGHWKVVMDMVRTYARYI